jgi:hypothetical protein
MLKYKKDNKEELVKKFEAKHGGGDKKQVSYHSGECRVADPGCLSRILLFTHPGSRIQQKRGVTKNFLPYLFL